MRGEKYAAEKTGARLRKASPFVGTSAFSEPTIIFVAIVANAICGCVGSGTGTPCSTTSGELAGNAFAALTGLSRPTTGPYQAVLASTAKRSASRQRPRASGVRRRVREAADNPDIMAVYHASAANFVRSSSPGHTTPSASTVLCTADAGNWDEPVNTPKRASANVPGCEQFATDSYRSRPLGPPLPLRAV